MKSEPETLALRAKPRPVTRLNRRMLIAAATAIAAVVLGVTMWSLQGNLRLPDIRPELHNVDRIARAEGLDRLPPDYSKVEAPKPPDPAPSVPVLGPPLPGDLGSAMFHAGQAHGAAPSPGAISPDARLDAQGAERMSREREADDAAKAPLFFRSSSQKHAKMPEDSVARGATPEPGHSNSDTPGLPVSSASSDTSHLAGSGRGVVSQHAIDQPVSPYQVMAGTMISAALLTGINSDLPGVVLAAVTEPVYDSKLGRYLLIPQGTRLIGEYANQVAFGQRRVLLVWNRLIFPDTTSLTLDKLPGVDTSGNAGLEDGVDSHWQRLLATAALSTLIGIGAELAAPNRGNGQNEIVVSTRQSVQDTMNQVGQELTRRNLDVQPTLTIRPGFPVRVIVSKDLVLRPYQPLFVNRSSE